MVSVGEKMSIDCTSCEGLQLLETKATQGYDTPKNNSSLFIFSCWKSLPFYCRLQWMYCLSLTITVCWGISNFFWDFCSHISLQPSRSASVLCLCVPEIYRCYFLFVLQTKQIDSKVTPTLGQLLRGISHHLCLSYLLLNDSIYPLKCSDFCTDLLQSGTSVMDWTLEEKNVIPTMKVPFAIKNG